LRGIEITFWVANVAFNLPPYYYMMMAHSSRKYVEVTFCVITCFPQHRS
jgi:hypothetical protein